MRTYISKGDKSVEFTEYDFYEMYSVLDYIATDKRKDDWEYRKHWFGGTYDDMKRLLTKGDQDSVEAAQHFADSFDSAIDVENLKPQIVNDVVGGSVSVGAYLAGVPNCMYRTIPVDVEVSNTTACRIFLPMDSWGNLSADQARAYGTICLGLAMKMQTLRQVELYSYSIGVYDIGEYRHRGTKVKLGTAPLELSTALAFCTQPVLQRGVIYAEQDIRATGNNYDTPSSGVYTKDVFKALDAEKTDIICPIVNIYEFEQIQKNPAAWIQSKIQTAFK